MKRILFFLFCCLVPNILLVVPSQATTPEELQAEMVRHLNCYPLKLVDLNGQQEISVIDEELCLATVYSSTGMQPLWVTVHGPGKKAATILHFLLQAGQEGLEPEDYRAGVMQNKWRSRDPADLAELDTLLTLGLIRYVHDITHGRIVPYNRDPVLFAEAGDKNFKPVLIIEQALQAPDLEAYLAGLPPGHVHYQRLKAALQHYRELAQNSDWQTIPAGKTIHPGDEDPRMGLIRERLVQEKIPDIVIGDDPLFDEKTVAAIKAFQLKSKLEVDTIIGPKTLAALNMTPEMIVEKIILNMARWRWQERHLGEKYIMVNIANYDLLLMDDGRELIRMPVIVGQFHHQTPVFSDRMRYLDFNPFWNIPPNIAMNEELPALRKDPTYLVNRHVRLFSDWQADAVEIDSTRIDWQSVTLREMRRFKLRQDPGPWNALGPVKFVFPNHHNVYIHGTPAQDLFERTTRAFSHGCIRASRPLLLANLLLDRQKEKWTMERINEVVEKGEREVVILKEPVPVHITYQTVWVDNTGEIHFNNDNYRRDKQLQQIFSESRHDLITTK